jgi:NAD(P)-dependent dehydrogenase (short-subunit alcohol dehydrogenase family)
MKKVALVTGANKGIGFETARQLASKGYQVILTARDPHKGEKAALSLTQQGLDVVFFPLDVTSQKSIESAQKYVAEKWGHLDVLVNNAGIFLEGEDLDTLKETLETNTYGPYLMCEAFQSLLIKSGAGRVVNVSSGMGQLSEMEGGYVAYRISKTALNAVTRVFAAKTSPNVLVNSVCPGWVKTDMGTSAAERSVEQGADTLVWLAMLPEGGPTGGFFRDRKAIEW